MSYKKKEGEVMLETLLKESYKQYMGIIVLAYHFQNATQIKGLQLEHFRYALVIKNDLTKRSKKEMDIFFEQPRIPNKDDHMKDDLTEINYHTMCEMKTIEKCISSRQNLSKTYLKNLIEAEVLIKDYPEQHGRKKHPRYRINPMKEKEIVMIIRKHKLKSTLTRTIDDSNDDAFQTLAKQIYDVLIYREIPLRSCS